MSTPARQRPDSENCEPPRTTVHRVNQAARGSRVGPGALRALSLETRAGQRDGRRRTRNPLYREACFNGEVGVISPG
jgi:hypothetical protein